MQKLIQLTLLPNSGGVYIINQVQSLLAEGWTISGGNCIPTADGSVLVILDEPTATKAAE